MLRYFRQNDPFRVIGLIGLILLTRIYLFVAVGADISPEFKEILNWENLFNGYEGPIFILFQSVFSFFGSNAYLNVILASIIILLNGALLNSILIRNSAFDENTFIPAALYIVLNSFQKVNFFISPELLGSTVMLVSLTFLLKHLRFRNSDENVINIGSTLAISSLFFLPFAWSLILVLILFLFYSGTAGRRYLLLVWGFMLILIICWVIALYFDRSEWFWLNYYKGLMSFEYHKGFTIDMAICLGFPLLIMDEACTSMDQMGINSVQETLRDWCESIEGHTCFFITHEPEQHRDTSIYQNHLRILNKRGRSSVVDDSVSKRRKLVKK